MKIQGCKGFRAFVFLLFAPPTGGRWRSSRNPVYAVDREALLAALKSFGQWPSIADD